MPSILELSMARVNPPVKGGAQIAILNGKTAKRRKGRGSLVEVVRARSVPGSAKLAS